MVSGIRKISKLFSQNLKNGESFYDAVSEKWKTGAGVRNGALII